MGLRECCHSNGNLSPALRLNAPRPSRPVSSRDLSVSPAVFRAGCAAQHMGAAIVSSAHDHVAQAWLAPVADLRPMAVHLYGGGGPARRLARQARAHPTPLQAARWSALQQYTTIVLNDAAALAVADWEFVV